MRALPETTSGRSGSTNQGRVPYRAMRHGAKQFLNPVNLALAVALVCIVAISSAALMTSLPAAGAAYKVVVHDSDGVDHILDLSVDDELVVQTSKGRNVVVVEDGTVRIESADCPNGDCTRQQAISAPGRQLICLPHELWVEIVADGSYGGQMDVGAVNPPGAPADNQEFDTVAR